MTEVRINEQAFEAMCAEHGLSPDEKIEVRFMLRISNCRSEGDQVYRSDMASNALRKLGASGYAVLEQLVPGSNRKAG